LFWEGGGEGTGREGDVPLKAPLLLSPNTLDVTSLTPPLLLDTTSEEDLTVTVLSVVSVQVDVDTTVETEEEEEEEADADVDVTPPVPVPVLMGLPVSVLLSAGGVAVSVSGADRLSVHDDDVELLLVVTASGVVRVSVHDDDDDDVEAEADVASGMDMVSSVQDVVVSGSWVVCVVSGSWVVCDEVSSVQVVSRGALAVLVGGGAAGEETVSPEVQLVEPVPVPEEDGGETVPVVVSTALVDRPAVPEG
jgi:hypothetical protein